MSLPEQSQQVLDIVTHAVGEKLGKNPVAIDVRERMPYADVFFITSADSDRQILAIADEVIDQVHEAGFARPRVEGREEASWVLIECPGVVVHVMSEDQRAFYNLEKLWADGKAIDLGVQA
ncbi:MAG: ribosome silencing factor [Actinomycetaceae bacterium]|nr:ribosome silencing factor [Actinomycetaceae bacterium]